MWLCMIAFCPGWRKNGALHIPALINSFHNGGVAYASSSAPLGYAKALVCHTTPPVCCLLFGGYRSELRYFGSYPSRFSCIAQARIHVKEVRV